MDQLLQNFRYAIRILRRSPGFTTVTTLTLALGIGVNTAIFSIVNAVFLAPLPFPHPDQLIQLFSTHAGQRRFASLPDIADFNEQNKTFQGLVGFDAWRKNVSGIGGSNQAEEMIVGLAAPQYFQVLGIEPLMGRIFTDEENHYGRHYEVLVNESFWRSRLGADAKVLGRSLKINDEQYTIIGVMPDIIPDWVDGRRILVWTPREHRPPPPSIEADRQSREWAVIGRLKPGVTIEQGRADLEHIAATLAQQHPLDRGFGVDIRPLVEGRRGPVRNTVWLLIGAVTFILLIACSNIANLLLARNTARNREFALRSALGASPSTLIHQLVVEALVLSCLGAIVGLGLGWFGSRLMAKLHPPALPQLAGTGMDWRVLLFTLVIAVITGFLFGLMPAFSSIRLSLVEALKEGGYTGSVGGKRQYFRRLIVVAEMAFSLMLVIGAALLVKSIVRLQAQQTGFSEDHLLRAHLFLPEIRYPNPASRTEFCDRFTERLRALPGVLQVTIATSWPGAPNGWTQNFTIFGSSVSQEENMPNARFVLADINYLKTLNVPLLSGRDFGNTDTDTALPVVLVNQEFAHQYFPQQDLLGRRIQLTGSDVTANQGAGTWLTIIGVIGNVKNHGLALPPDPQIVGLFRQIPPLNFGFKDVVVRTATDPYQMADTVARQLHEIDPDMPLAEVTSIQDAISGQTLDTRFITALLGLFAVLGFALAIVGVYGVISYLVAQQTQEIGIRMALGAQRSNVLWLVLRQGLSLSVAGIVLGLCGAWQVANSMRHLLWGVSPADTATFAAAAIGLVAVAVLATAIPGFRAMRIDPLMALRGQ